MLKKFKKKRSMKNSLVENNHLKEDLDLNLPRSREMIVEKKDMVMAKQTEYTKEMIREMKANRKDLLRKHSKTIRKILIFSKKSQEDFLLK